MTTGFEERLVRKKVKGFAEGGHSSSCKDEGESVSLDHTLYQKYGA
jgi:hypothetical protein